jgi:hypothetical protein
MMTKHAQAACLAVTLAAVLGAAPAAAQGGSQGRGRGGTSTATTTTTTASVSVVFRDSDRVTYRDYFTTHKIVAQPLPPGIAKNVARGKPLPPGIAKKAVPTELIAIGPKVEKDVSFAIVGEVVVALKGGIVIDVMAGVFSR